MRYACLLTPTCHFSHLAYNLNVPTPFYHLSVAQELLESPALNAAVRRFLCQHAPAFYLGKTAPDVQVISGQARADTHFYSIPVRTFQPAWERMFTTHPDLADSRQLSGAQAAFLAGYICHLQADQLWALEIFNPVFGLGAAWGSFRWRLYLHNVLRAYLDRQVLPRLDSGTGATLSSSVTAGWLPFVADIHLARWRDLLASQLQPGATIRTVEVFARRQGLSVEAFNALLDSDEAMQAQIFSLLPKETLARYRAHVLAGNLTLLEQYLVGCAHL